MSSPMPSMFSAESDDATAEKILPFTCAMEALACELERAFQSEPDRTTGPSNHFYVPFFGLLSSDSLAMHE